MHLCIYESLQRNTNITFFIFLSKTLLPEISKDLIFYFSVFRDPPVAALVHINCCTLLDNNSSHPSP